MNPKKDPKAIKSVAMRYLYFEVLQNAAECVAHCIAMTLGRCGLAQKHYLKLEVEMPCMTGRRHYPTLRTVNVR